MKNVAGHIGFIWQHYSKRWAVVAAEVAAVLLTAPVLVALVGAAGAGLLGRDGSTQGILLGAIVVTATGVLVSRSQGPLFGPSSTSNGEPARTVGMVQVDFWIAPQRASTAK